MYISSRSGKTGASLLLAAGLAAAFCTTAMAADLVVATVNGVGIQSNVLDLYVQSRTKKPAAQATAQERQTALDELINVYLLTTQPRATELAKDPAVQAQIELQAQGVLAQAVANDYFDKNPPSEEDIAAQYQALLKSSPPLQFKARHILVDTQESAKDLISKLDKGADFQELAKANSKDASAKDGGELGWFSPDQMVKPFSEAVSKLENGHYTPEPVQTQFGWHVILREDSRENEPPTLESVHDAIKQHIEQTKFQAYLEGLRAEYDAAQ
jgi:peptidyl-prolyl cis-trans isomerase C